MSFRDQLAAAAKVIADEMERNKAFRQRMEEAIHLAMADASPAVKGKSQNAKLPVEGGARKGGRRTPAVIDPIALAREGEDSLRRDLARLDIEQLRDVVAEHGMDPGKLVMKWKDRDRITERIVELAMARSTKGDAFRADKAIAKMPPESTEG